MHKINKLCQSFGYAWEGVFYAFTTQMNLRIHTIATVCVVVAGFYFSIATYEWLALIAAITLVWFSELVNTAFEYLCDVVSPEHNESVKRAKDIAAAAVLVCSIGAMIVGVIVFVPSLSVISGN